MYHLSLQSKVSWKIQSLHISLEGGLICFSLTSSSQPLSFANIILCRLDQVPWHTFVQQSNTHKHVSLIIPWALSSVRLSQWAVNRSAIYMFLHLFSIKIIDRESKFVTKQLSDKSLASFHSSQIYTNNVAFLAIRQKRHLHLEVSWERGSSVLWATTIHESTLVVATSSHKNVISRVILGNPLQLKFPVSG